MKFRQRRRGTYLELLDARIHRFPIEYNDERDKACVREDVDSAIGIFDLLETVLTGYCSPKDM
jgi:hypothetical protein